MNKCPRKELPLLERDEKLKKNKDVSNIHSIIMHNFALFPRDVIGTHDKRKV